MMMKFLEEITHDTQPQMQISDRYTIYENVSTSILFGDIIYYAE